MLVGRESAVSLLAERIEERRAVAVLGEAGVGKTSLVRAAAERAGKPSYEAGGLATLAWLPYLPLRRAFGREFEPGDTAYVAGEVEREVGAALLFLDDLHWADSHTRALVPLLGGRIPLVAAIRRGDPGTAVALEAAAGAGLELLPLGPLAPAEAAELAGLLHPELPHAATQRLVSRSGGNPFLLEQLAATGEPSESLQLALAARLRLLSPAARETIASLALLGRPAAPELLGAGADELVSAGLATANGDVSIRHALIADATIEQLEARERQRLHSRLAASVRDVGEAARHHAAAGERASAHEKALLAAERAPAPGERASHLALAAECAAGPDAARLRIEAASLLNGVGDYDGALELLEAVPSDDALRDAEVALLRGRAAVGSWDFERARTELDEARHLAAGSGGELEVRIEVERLRLDLQLDVGDTTSAVLRERADAVLALARERGCPTASVLRLVAQARADDSWEDSLREAMAGARAEGDVLLECEIADHLGLPSFPPRRSLMAEMAERAHRLRLTAWERRFRCRLAGLDFHAGEFRAAYEAGEALLTQRLEPWERYLIAYYAAQAASDLGLHRRARALVDELDRLAVEGAESKRQAKWARADVELLAGRPRAALAAADEALLLFPHNVSTFILLARGWACLELSRDPGEPDLGDLGEFLAGARPELAGIRLLADERPVEASRLFATAAEQWHGRHARGELRCLWATGEALRRAGKNGAAVDALLVAEERAATHEHLPFLHRVHRSLRLAGERRTATRSRDGALTAREREVLGLVADRLSNDEIARRLGVGRATVVRLIRTASAELGARSRTQAAALAVRR